jgi:hypothetical protein
LPAKAVIQERAEFKKAVLPDVGSRRLYSGLSVGAVVTNLMQIAFPTGSRIEKKLNR